MRAFTLVLLALIGLVQMELWTGRGGLPRVWALRAELETQRGRNDLARQGNERLAAEVTDLRTGLEMVEERARLELGMIGPREVLVVATAPGTKR